MANPQKENGHTRIANELLQALMRVRIPGEATQLLFVVFYKTYGWNKKSDHISLSQFVLATGLKKPNVCRGLRILQEMNIIIKKDNAHITSYSINKDFDTWKPLSKKITLSKKIITVIENDNDRYQKRYTQKQLLQKQLLQNHPQFSQNEKTAERDDDHKITLLIQMFKAINPTLDEQNITQRKAMQTIVTSLEGGFKEANEVIQYALSIQGEQRAPIITTPLQLKNKLGDLGVYHQRANPS